MCTSCRASAWLREVVSEEQSRENPIRRIVNLLQQMAKEVEEEGDRDKDMHEKFVC